MKKIPVSIWKRITSIFKRREVVVKKETLIQKIKERSIPKYNNPIIPAHNNRKRTKSRHVQVDPTTGRTIYHGVK